MEPVPDNGITCEVIMPKKNTNQYQQQPVDVEAPIHTSVESSPENTASNYLLSTGMKSFSRLDSFWSHLRKTYGKAAVQLKKFMDNRGDGLYTDEFYSIKNSTLNLSIDVASAFAYDLYREYTKWFLKENFKPPGRLLDIGCENGILTCFYAKTFPGSEIVGMDKCANAIDCARELARRMSLTNVKFEVADIKELPAKLTASTFDCITAVTVFHEAVPNLQDEELSWSIDNQDFLNKYPEANKTIKAIAALINPLGGYMVSVDRLANAPEIIKWFRLISESGLAINWERSCALPFRNIYHETEKLCVSVSSPGLNKEVTAGDDILAFIASNEGDKDELSTTIEGSMAEALFRSVNPKTRVWGREITYKDGSGIMRAEFWKAGALVIRYEYSNTGYRRLLFAPKNRVNELIQLCETETEAIPGVTDVSSY
jgi:SAM-dependent methyltransferase